MGIVDIDGADCVGDDVRVVLFSVDGRGADVLFVGSSWPLNLTVPVIWIWADKGSIIGRLVRASTAGSGGTLRVGRWLGASVA